MKIKSTAKAFHNNIFEISEQEAKRLIEKQKNYECEEKQLFIVSLPDPISRKYLAIDNSTEECYVETFDIKEDAYIWLLGLKEAEPLQKAEEELKEWY